MIDVEHDERKILEVRKHWYVIFKESIVLIFFLFLPVILYTFIEISPISLVTPGNEDILFIFLYLAWLLVFWSIFFFLWTEYYLDVWIITDQKMVDVDQVSLFKREISTLQLDKIQDVTVEVHGLIPTILHFGSLHVQTAGDQREFVIHNIAKPQLVKDILSSAIEEYNREHFGGYKRKN
jgi:uncharacterized membrane protein YdbT with pleckstrin-like domain